MNKYKTFEELKEELGDKFEDYMYKANIELLNKLDKIKEKIKEDNEYLEFFKTIYVEHDDELVKTHTLQLINNNLLYNDNILKLLEEVE